ncbi:MAG: histidine kinase [Rubrivivax sp.]|nr:histidine kinase [Rubrivivax sp.]
MPTASSSATCGSGLSAVLRRGLLNQLVCLAIGIGYWAASPSGHGFWVAYLYSFVIGNLIWLSIDGGRELMVRLLGQGAEQDWPGWLAMGPLVVLGGVGGYSIGSTIVDALLGLRSPSLFASRGSGIVTLVIAAVVTYVYYTRERLHVQKTEAEHARSLALENQLKLLQSQLEPHMLFNTLANLRVLIGIDPPKAQAMLDRLIGFLRATLAASRSETHPLADEFARVGDYLALMQVRMGARLQVSLNLPDELRDCAVPPLVLQPLAENAIKHGLEPRVEGGRICVRARRVGAELELSVRDTGVGLSRGSLAMESPASAAVAGSAGADAGRYGTAHVRTRLQAMFGQRARFELQPAGDDEGGTLALIVLPVPLPTPHAA